MAQTQKPFLIAIGVIILAGAAFIGMRMTKNNVSIPANAIVTTADTAGFQGYVLGSPDAPIEITEYADYQCPGCGAFATVQFPDIKVRLIDAGKVRFRYRRLPARQHPPARPGRGTHGCLRRRPGQSSGMSSTGSMRDRTTGRSSRMHCR